MGRSVAIVRTIRPVSVPSVPPHLPGTRSALDAAERADPRGHAMHVVAAAVWAFLQSLTNAGEGIAWGVLAAVALARVPKVWRCYRAPVRDPVFLALLGWSAWMPLTVLWGPDLLPADRPLAPERWVLTPLLLWPVMARPWLVLGAMGVGATVQVGLALAWSWTGAGWARYVDMRSLSNFGQLVWQVSTAATLAGVALRFTPWKGKGPLAVAWAAGMLAVALTAVRTAMVSLLVALAVVAARPRWRRRPSAWVIAAAAVALLGAASSMVMMSPAMERIQASFDRAQRLETFEVDGQEALLEAVSSSRLTLARAAIDMGIEHPVFGGGRGSFRVELPRWAVRRMAQDPDWAPLSAPLTDGTLSDAHNALLQAWAEGGIPAVLLISYALFGLGWRLWKQSAYDRPAAAAMALFSLVLVAVPVSIVTAKAPGAIIATCLAVSWAVSSEPARRVLEREP